MDSARRSGSGRRALSALALLFRRDGAPADSARLAAVLGRLAHRGPHGAGAWTAGPFALGHRHFWTTPEDVGERQPLADARGGLRLLFDGRLDNREELAAALELDSGWRALSDGTLVLRAWRRWGEACLERLLGPFALAAVDLLERRVVLGRDALGDRTLFYVLRPDLLAVASEESALLALRGVSARLDERSLARFFAVDVPEPGATFFADVRELPPAHGLAVEPGRERAWRWWQADPTPRLRLRRDADYAEAFRETLAAAVRCRLRATAPPAVQMSGGLDSTSVAALAAREQRRGGGPEVRTVSWVFDELAPCDERRWMDPVLERWDLPALRVAGDDAWPLARPESWPHNPNTPMEGLYRRLAEKVYAAARAAGTVVLLNGEYGDELYAGGDGWLADLLREGRLAAGARGVAAHLWTHTLRRRPARYGLRNAAGRTLGRLRRPGAAPLAAPPWLTPEAAALFADAADAVPWASSARRPWQHRALLDAVGPRATTTELHHAGRAGVDLRRPYRDRRLVELALALPAHQLYRPGWLKWVLRQAMRGLLPEPVRLRRRPNSLLPLCVRGLREREVGTVRRLLADPDAVWPRYVRADWLARVPAERFARALDGPELIVPWQCVCAELWRRGERAAIDQPLAMPSFAG